MNILFVDQFGTPGGAQQCLRDLVPAVLARGWTAHAGLPADGNLAAQLAAMGAVPHQIQLERYTNGRKSLGDVLRFGREVPRLADTIRRIIRHNGIDIVYVNGPRMLPAVALVSEKVVFHSHSLFGPGHARLLAGACLRERHARLIASSQYVARPLQRYVRPERRRVVYNGVRDHGPVRHAPRSNGPWTIGMIGRIAPEKGQCDFVRAARILLDMLPDCKFVICGDPLHSGSGYRDRVHELARGLPIEFIGWREDIGPVLRELDVLALPSTAVEATPRAIPEAFSAGVPVVAYPSGGIPELVEHGVNGLLTAESSPESLAWTMRAALAKPEEMWHLSENARRTYEARFTLERFRQDVLSILHAWGGT